MRAVVIALFFSGAFFATPFRSVIFPVEHLPFFPSLFLSLARGARGQEETRKNDGKPRVIHGRKWDCLDKREREHLARMSASFNANREASTTHTCRRLPASRSERYLIGTRKYTYGSSDFIAPFDKTLDDTALCEALHLGELCARHFRLQKLLRDSFARLEDSCNLVIV
jgi:hypothetical protein